MHPQSGYATIDGDNVDTSFDLSGRLIGGGIRFRR